jgi:hypothetical protein
MTSTPATLGEQREILAAALGVLAGIGQVLHQAGGDALGELLGEVDALAAAAGGARCEVVLEAKRRGEILDSGKNTREWVVEYAPSLRQAGAAQLARLVDTVSSRSSICAGREDPLSADPDTPLTMIWARARTGEAAPALALAALAEMDRLGDRLVPSAVPTVTTALLDIGVGFGRASMSELRVRLLAAHGVAHELDDEHERLRPHAHLSAPRVESGDLTTYIMGLTPEQAAVLEAALGPLARPRPNEQTGEPDLRSNGQRRAEALAEICSRAGAVDAATKGGPAESDACVFVAVQLDTLREHSGAGEVLGSAASGALLAPETLRKMCCDAALIPVVLGTDGEQLDLGRVQRLFTRAQRRAIWRRDRTCTYPGCGAPGAWTKVHHVHHWADGGRSDIDNAALLCQRHHTQVHSRRLWAEVRSRPDESGRYVHWDLTSGSYDRELRRMMGDMGGTGRSHAA